MAAVRGERDIAVGNVMGSNLSNIMGVLGFASLCSGDGITVPASALRFDIPVMIAVAFVCLPVFFTRHMIARWEGAVLLAYYFVYTGYLVLAATNVAVTRTFASVMLGIALPLTTTTLLGTVTRSWRGAAKSF